MRACRGAMMVGAAVALGVVCGLCVGAEQKAGPARLAAPSGAALMTAGKATSEAYGDDLADPTARGRLRLALRMLEDAKRTNDDPAGKYALLLRARELASEAGDLQTAFDAIAALDAGYVVEAPVLGQETLEKTAPKLDTPEERGLLADYCVYVMGQLAAENRYVELEGLYPMVESAARLSASAQVRARVALAVQRLQAAAVEYQKAKPAFEALKRNPDDPAANEAAGKFCFVYGTDRAKALGLLARGPDAPDSWKGQAVRDLAGPESADHQAALAEDWWTAAQSQTGATKERLEAESILWYRRAQPGLGGLTRALAEKRIAADSETEVVDWGRPPRHGVSVGPPATPPPPVRPPLRITILSARWGGGRHWSDVTDKVKQFFEGHDAFYANPGTLGADPTPGWRKHLEITYLKDGRRRRLVRDEDQKIDPLVIDQ